MTEYVSVKEYLWDLLATVSNRISELHLPNKRFLSQNLRWMWAREMAEY